MSDEQTGADVNAASVERRVAIVSGGGTGIGAAITRALRDAGWDVVIFGRRPHALSDVAEETGALAITAA